MFIEFIPMNPKHMVLWETWIKKPHVKDVWFIEGYEPAEYIYQKIRGNGYDYPFIIYLNKKPIGYIVCCDLYAYCSLCNDPKGLFKNENPGTFCMDLFIGEETDLNKGYGTQIVKAFIDYIFDSFHANTIFIDPATTNTRAIRCYEKAGFKIVKTANDGLTDCLVMKIEKPKKKPIILDNHHVESNS